MSDTPKFVEFDLKLDKDDVEFLDREAARRGHTRDEVIGQAINIFVERHRHILEDTKAKVENEAEASRTGHAADKPPTAD